MRAPSVFRLPDREEQKAVRGRPGARRAGRVRGQVRAGRGRHGRVRLAVPVGLDGHPGHPDGVPGHPGGPGRADHADAAAAAAIVVARLAVRLPVGQRLVAVAVPRGRRHQQHPLAAAAPPVGRRRRALQAAAVRLRSRAAGGRQLDSGRRGRRPRAVPSPLVRHVAAAAGRGGDAAVRGRAVGGAAAHVPAGVPQGGAGAAGRRPRRRRRRDGPGVGSVGGPRRTARLRRRVVRAQRVPVLPAAALPRGAHRRRGRRHAHRQLRLRGPVRHQARRLLQHRARHRVRAPQEQPVRGPGRRAVRPATAAAVVRSSVRASDRHATKTRLVVSRRRR